MAPDQGARPNQGASLIPWTKRLFGQAVFQGIRLARCLQGQRSNIQMFDREMFYRKMFYRKMFYRKMFYRKMFYRK
jgi:hypothetical protein